MGTVSVTVLTSPPSRCFPGRGDQGWGDPCSTRGVFPTQLLPCTGGCNSTPPRLQTARPATAAMEAKAGIRAAWLQAVLQSICFRLQEKQKFIEFPPSPSPPPPRVPLYPPQLV